MPELRTCGNCPWARDRRVRTFKRPGSDFFSDEGQYLEDSIICQPKGSSRDVRSQECWYRKHFRETMQRLKKGLRKRKNQERWNT